MDEKVEALSNLIDKIVKKEIYLEGGRKTGEIDSICIGKNANRKYFAFG